MSNKWKQTKAALIRRVYGVIIREDIKRSIEIFLLILMYIHVCSFNNICNVRAQADGETDR